MGSSGCSTNGLQYLIIFQQQFSCYFIIHLQMSGSKKDERICTVCWQCDAFYLVVDSDDQLEFGAWINESCKKLDISPSANRLFICHSLKHLDIESSPFARRLFSCTYDPVIVRKCGLAFLPCCIWLDASYFYHYNAGKSRDVKNLHKREKTAWGQEIIEAVGKAGGDGNQS